MLSRRKSSGDPPETPLTAAVKALGWSPDNFRRDNIAEPHGKSKIWFYFLTVEALEELWTMDASCPLQDLADNKPVSTEPDPVFQAKESEGIELFKKLTQEQKKLEMSILKKNVTAICNMGRKDYRK